MKEIAKLFKYDQYQGRIFWNIKKQGIRIGDEGRSIVNGYARVTVNGKSYPVHHIIWFIEKGYRPLEIDHINRDKLDNKISNLREVTHADNQKNHPKYKSNTSGVTGVSFHKRVKKWEARIQRKCLGYFKDFDDAVKARKKAEVAYNFYQ